MEIKTITIELEKWQAVNNHYLPEKSREINSQLLTMNNTMCCLGFVCRSIHIPETDLRGAGMPKELISFMTNYELLTPLENAGLVTENDGRVNNSALSNSAANINDDKDISLEEKMSKIGSLFLGYGYRLRFVLKGWIVIHDSGCCYART